MSARRIKTDRENKTEGEVQQDTSQISEELNKRSTKGISDMYIFDKERERERGDEVDEQVWRGVLCPPRAVEVWRYITP